MNANPIVTKELVSVLRSRGAFVLAVVSVGVISFLGLAIWPEAGINPEGAAYSRLFLTVVLFGQIVMLALFTPPFSSTSITYEKESNTWEMLYFSLLRPDQILLGKLVGAVAFLLILAALSLPVAGICFLLGGVPPGDVFLAYMVLLMAGATFGLIGLTCSSLLPTSFMSLVATYLILMVLCGGVQIPPLLLPKWIEGQAGMHAARCLSPFTALYAITFKAFGNMGPNAWREAVTRYFLYSGLACAVMVLIVLLRIARRPLPKVRKRRGVVDKSTRLSVRIMRRLFFVIDPRRQRRSIPLLMNPILSLDLRTRAAGVSNLIRACFGCLIFSIGIVIVVSGPFGEGNVDLIRVIALSFQLGLITLIGPSLTIAAIAGEVEGRTLDSLRMTPLRPWTILSGKLFGALMLSIMLIVASVPVFFAILYIQEDFQPRYLTAMFSITAAMVMFALTAGLFFSSVSRTTARAAAWAYGLMALVTVGSVLGYVLRERLSEKAASFILSFNPIVTVIGAVSTSQFTEYGYWPGNVRVLGSLSAVLLALTIWRLHRLTGPTP